MCLCTNQVTSLNDNRIGRPPVGIKYFATADGNRLQLGLPQPLTAHLHRSSIQLLPPDALIDQEEATMPKPPRPRKQPSSFAERGALMRVNVRLGGCFSAVAEEWLAEAVLPSVQPVGSAEASTFHGGGGPDSSMLVEGEERADSSTLVEGEEKSSGAGDADATASGRDSASPAVAFSAKGSNDSGAVETRTTLNAPDGVLSAPVVGLGATVNSPSPSEVHNSVGGESSGEVWMRDSRPAPKIGVEVVVDHDHSDLSVGQTVFAWARAPTGEWTKYQAKVIEFHKTDPKIKVKYVSSAEGNTLELLLPQPRVCRLHRSNVERMADAPPMASALEVLSVIERLRHSGTSASHVAFGWKVSWTKQPHGPAELECIDPTTGEVIRSIARLKNRLGISPGKAGKATRSKTRDSKGAREAGGGAAGAASSMEVEDASHDSGVAEQLGRTVNECSQPAAATYSLTCANAKGATTEASAHVLTGLDEASQAAFNRQLEPLLHTGPNASGVMPTSVPEDMADACAAFLRENWTSDKLMLGDHDACLGYHNYFKTLRPHDPGQQALSTLLFPNQLLEATRNHLPGFAAMEGVLAQWLRSRFGRRYELYYAHAIKQGPATLRSTGFGVHQDTEVSGAPLPLFGLYPGASANATLLPRSAGF